MMPELSQCVRDYFEYIARMRPNVEFSRFGNRVRTYGEAERRANRIANALVASGCTKGSRFGLLAENCDETPLIYLAAAKCGAVPVPLNFRLAAREWQLILNDAGVRLVIARDDKYIQGMSALRDNIPSLRSMVALDGEVPSGWLAWESWLDKSSDARPDIEICGSDVLYQMYTSGTTGLPKGAMLTNANAIANAHQAFLGAPYRVSPGERVSIMLPMFHASGGFGALLAVLAGATMVVHTSADPVDIVRVLSEERIAATILVPALIQACTLVPGVERMRFPALKYIGYGASPIAEEVLRRGMQVFKCDFMQGYGMTETTAGVSFLNEHDHRRALADRPELLRSAGRAFVSTDIRIVDEHDQDVPIGTVGEVVVRGPQIMAGYWNQPDKTAEALRGGWMHTGDAARLDEEGYLFIEDRIQDMIVSGGENVYPREVENVLFEHPAIADAAVIGIPDEKWGESVLALCVRRPGKAVSEAELAAFSRQQLAGYKVPRQVEFVANLPRNASGKVLKNELRAPYWKGKARQVN